MPQPQSIVQPLTGAAVFLVLTIRDGGESTVREVLGELQALRRSVGFRVPETDLACVVGIGSSAWDRLFSGPRPQHLTPFAQVAGSKHTAPATVGDLLFHLRAATMDLCFELGHYLVDRLRGAADVVDETHGFRYFEQRDLLGFVDGTENPEGAAAEAASLLSTQEPSFAGGSYVMVQKYLHDLDSWNAIGVEEQERVIGRRKETNVELAESLKPANSHVALNDLADGPDGPRQVLRANMSFGTLGEAEFGTYYIAYAADPGVTREMLEHMFLGEPPGNYDRILDFSTAVTGTEFFCPSIDFLEDQPAQPGVGPLTSTMSATQPLAEGSLGIGNLGRTRP